MEEKLKIADDIIMMFQFEASNLPDGTIATSQGKAKGQHPRQYQIRFIATVEKIDEFYLFLACPSLTPHIEKLKGRQVEISFNYGYKNYYYNTVILGRYNGYITVAAPRQVHKRDRWDNYLLLINYKAS